MKDTIFKHLNHIRIGTIYAAAIYGCIYFGGQIYRSFGEDSFSPKQIIHGAQPINGRAICILKNKEGKKKLMECPSKIPEIIWVGDDIEFGAEKITVHKIEAEYHYSDIKEFAIKARSWACKISDNNERLVWLNDCNPYECDTPSVVHVPHLALLKHCKSIKDNISRIELISEQGSIRLF
jgi:hypothetical protein